MRNITTGLNAWMVLFIAWACSDGHEPMAPREQGAYQGADAAAEELKVEGEEVTLGEDSDSSEGSMPVGTLPQENLPNEGQPAPPAFYPASCAALRMAQPDASSGVYKIYLNATAADRVAVDASCDMSEDGGGWTLVLNYLHKSNSNPELFVRPTSLPLLGSDRLGSDESVQTKNWGHASLAMLAKFAFKELRFFCRSSENTRVVHFKTQEANCIAAVQKGTGNCIQARMGAVVLTGHNGILPAAANTGLSDQKDFALTYSPFYAARLLGDADWNIRGDNSSWDCDSISGNAAFDTLHRVWVR